ncbi:tyrosine-type recombinase/integrase [Sporosarcina highlanderae]|uniref:Tyrosine-type recombinase/integrase n=1 Tax=Sporosarcina highlanderae TaxID=3035916 RepID=A0ABT8JRK2_9BACL|nr:site-specific integrase [Sporosarcina highlanderae]MDN4607171.1 tyrosine-type recombinase/integrase [Sporosarcina highlanderae]
MVIEKSINLSIEEICSQLGISEKSLINFLESNGNESETQNVPVVNVQTAIFVIDKYLEHLEKMVKVNQRSKETWTTYNNFLKRVKSYLYINNPSLKINELNEIILNDIIIHESNNNAGYSIQTINKYNAIIKSLLKFAFEMDYTNKSLGYKFTIQKATILPRYIHDDHIPKIFETIKDFSKPSRCRAMIMFLLLTGCRVSEISKIRVKDFDIENDLIFIYDSKWRKDRIIPIYPKLKDEILLYLQKSGMKEWSPTCEGFLFARDEGIERKRNFPTRTIRYLIERIRKCVPELSYMTTHSFRHTFAVKCIKVGIEGHLLADMLGHEDPQTTKVYTKLHGEDLRDEIINKFPFPFERLLNALNDDKDED